MRKPAFCTATLLVLLMVMLFTFAGCGEKPKPLEKEMGGNETVHNATEPEAEEGRTRPADEQLLYDFFGAVNEHRYQDAYNMCSEKYRSQIGYEVFVSGYQDYIKSVKVKSLRKLPEYSSATSEMFQVVFDAAYIKLYPAGSGYLPEFYTLVPDPNTPGKRLLDQEGTGP